MAKMRVYEIARDLGMQNKELVDWLQANGFEDIKSHSSSLDGDQARAVMDKIRAEREPQEPAVPPQGFVVRRRRAAVQAAAAEAAKEKEAEEAAAREAAEEEAAEAEKVAAAAEAQEPREAEEAPPPPQVETAPAAPQQEAEQPDVPQAPAEIRAEAEAEKAAEAAAPKGEEKKPAAEAAEKKAEEIVDHDVPTPNMPGVVAPNVPVHKGVDPKTLTPTPTRAVVISRPLVPVRRVTPPPSPGRGPGGQPGRRAIGEVREVRVVPGTTGRGRDFIDVNRDRRGQRRGPRAPATQGGPPSKRDLLAMASGRAGMMPVRGRKRRPTKRGAKTQITVPKESKRVIRIEEGISVTDLSQRLGVKATELLHKLIRMGVMANINQVLDVDTAQILASDYDYTVEHVGFVEEEFLAEEQDAPEDLKPRPPVVTIMGHVDHGKTSLLDALRKANVAKGEAGGITQHIGAYSVQTGKGPVTFLDTPGHEAFTSMRARGAQITDVAVLVVAADDGVMPQTIESINHAKDAEVPIVVAINKIDKPEANPDRVRQALGNHGLVPEEWGGETIMIPVSAKEGTNLDQLLEYIALQSEILELQANPDRSASGVVIEAKLERGRGPVATVLVQNGTLRTGDAIVSGTFYGRLRAMTDDRGKRVKEVKPGYPVEIIGLNGVPSAGDEFHVVKDVKAAEEIASNREIQERKKDLAKTAKVSLEELFAREQGDQKELKVILKADVQGSAEAMAQALEGLTTEKVRVTVVHRGVGAITESDINLAKASGAIVVGFNTKPEGKVDDLARSMGIDVRQYNVIYDAVDDVRLAMEGLLDVITREKVIGKAEVRMTFSVPRFGQIAGSAVIDGKVTRSAFARVLRGKEVLAEGRIASLRRFKDDVREVAQGFECGIAVEGFTSFQEGDIIEAYEIEQIRQTL